MSEVSHSFLLQVESVSLSFQGVKAISDLSFSVRRHEICSLIGPNGAGKSSLLNVLNGVYRADAGWLHYDGARFDHLEPLEAARRGIGRTFQNNALFKKMSVLDNIVTGLSKLSTVGFLSQALALPRARAEAARFRERSEQVIEFLALQAWRDVPVEQLSYGLQKRVELGRALIAEPQLLLLDEPMAGMNADEKVEMSTFIADINRELGTTVVLIEHDMGVVMSLSNHVVVLDYGRKVGDGSPDEVKNNSEVIAAYLGTVH